MSLLKPVDLPVSQGYYGLNDPASGRAPHYGIDFSRGPSSEGAPIIAAKAGVVIYSAFEPGGFGNTVAIFLDEPEPYAEKIGYGHLWARALPKVGDHVEAGQVIGYVGTTGQSTGFHLHFWAGGNASSAAIDPTPLIIWETAPPAPPPDTTEEDYEDMPFILYSPDRSRAAIVTDERADGFQSSQFEFIPANLIRVVASSEAEYVGTTGKRRPD